MKTLITKKKKRVLGNTKRKKFLKVNQKTILLVIYNDQNQRRYIGIKLD